MFNQSTFPELYMLDPSPTVNFLGILGALVVYISVVVLDGNVGIARCSAGFWNLCEVC